MQQHAAISRCELEVKLSVGLAVLLERGQRGFRLGRDRTRMVAVAASASPTAAKAKAALPTFKQYREADGKFYFKLAAADGRLLLQSAAFDTGRDAGQWVNRLKTDGASALADAPVSRGEGVSAQDVSDALAALAAQ